MNVAGQFSSLTAAVLPAPADRHRQPHVQSLFSEYERQVFARTNQFFTWLMALQWIFAMVLACGWSSRTWSGTESSVHPHVLAAIFLGGLLTLPPIWLMRYMPFGLATRQIVAVAQMGMSALLIDLTGGRIETHFHIFGSLAFLALYRDWRVLPTATAVVALDHLLGGIWYPELVYGVPYATVWRTAEHAVWVIFEDSVLAWACLVSRREMWEICLRHDQYETLNGELEKRVRERTRDLQLSEERYRQLIANIPIGIVETTRDGELLLANPHILSLLGRNEPGDASRIHLADGKIFPVPDRQRFWNELEAAREVRCFETTLYRADGQHLAVVVNARLKPAPTGAESICEATIEDITARKEATEKLARLNGELVLASRQAGQADVATGVLHNVGNVLTSVNLIVNDLQDRFRATRLKHLHLLVGTLQRERHRLGDFFTADPAGRAFPGFLAKLDEHLTAETEQMSQDVDTLVAHCNHIREIIVVQQSSARLYGVIECMAPVQLMDEALYLNAESFGRHGMVLVKEYAEVPKIKADRHKVMQILVNLLKNAKDSVLSATGTEHVITVSVAALEDKSVALTVVDTGTGIRPENILRIFQHGFTTKKDGHGFGLHSSVLAAREMGGDLTAASDGPGKGATFSLILPVSELAA